MIDRDARNQLATLIRRYLDEEILSEDFFEELYELPNSDDTVIRYVVDIVSTYCDDRKNHLVVLSKPEWGYFQRLLLLLDSNSTVTIKRSYIWSFTQLVAAVLLTACLFIIMQTGFGYHLFIYFIPLGIGSIMLTRFRRPEIQNNPYYEIVAPFQSINDIHIAYESANFVKQLYPRHLKSRRIFSPVMEVFLEIYYWVLWIFLPWGGLLIQCFPDTNDDVRVNPA